MKKERDNADVALLVMFGLAIVFIALLVLTFVIW
jgi:Na+-transporting methylmalonyl-CoA/oxaloacetate decarboxylase gamma subunit